MIIFAGTDYEIEFKLELSYVLIPLTIYLYLSFPLLKSILNNHMACISIIGSIDTLLRINRISKFQLICSLVFHLGIFYFLGNYDNSKVHAKINSLNINEYIRMNSSKISIYLLVVALTIIIFLPWWPYDLPRNELFILYILIYYLYDLVNNNLNK